MLFKAVLLGFTVFTSSVSANCYTSGMQAFSVQALKNDLYSICHLIHIYTPGGFIHNQSKVVCWPGGDKRWDLVVQRVSSSPAYRVLDIEECINGLIKEINCDKGGSSTYSNWKYT